jgi:hypothetical protein
VRRWLCDEAIVNIQKAEGKEGIEEGIKKESYR